jgi:hypothetical protein
MQRALIRLVAALAKSTRLASSILVGSLASFAMTGTLVAQTPVTPSTGMISWWPGDGNASDIVDGNNGTIVGPVGFAPGKVGLAFSFNGTTGAIDAGNAADLQVSAGDFSIEAWVYYNSLFNADTGVCLPMGCDMSIVDKMFDPSLALANQNGWRLMKQAANYFLFCLGGVNTNGCGIAPQSVFSPVGSVSAGIWYHVVAVKAASTISLYVNGVQAGQTTLGGFNDTNQADLLIGANAVEGSHTNGLIDEATIYNRALSAAEISALYNAGSAGKYKLTPVSIIVKPGVSPPVLTREAAEEIRVAILSNANFDATQINSDTIRTAGPSVNLRGKGGRCFPQDVDGDGALDLVCDVRAGESITDGSTIFVLEAKTVSGQAVRGQQEITITGRSSDKH